MTRKNKKILVTGSSGFVGKKLVRKLTASKYEVITADIKEGIDLTDFDEVKKINDFDTVIHLAAHTFVPDSFKKPWEYYNNNIRSTLNLLEICRIQKAGMIYLSSYVYGKPEYLPIDEKHPVKGYNPYSQTKIICEQICEGYHRDHNVPSVILRPSNIYGDGQNENFLIPKILSQLKKGEMELKYSKPKRDYIFVDDFVDALCLVVKKEIKGFEIYNIGFGKSYSVKGIVEIIKKIIKKNIIVQFEKASGRNDIMDTVYNIDKIKLFLEWEPRIDIEQGLEKLIRIEGTRPGPSGPL